MRIPLFKANKSFTEYEKCCIENLEQLSCMISAELHYDASRSRDWRTVGRAPALTSSLRCA